MRAKRSLPGLLAVGVAGALAMSGAVGASSALACTGTAILGQGSSLQLKAQETWIANGGAPLCVTYTGSGSAAGLKAFGVGKTESPKSSKDVYIGTDDAPNGTFSTGQLGEMEEEALGTTEKKQDLVIPVLQAAIGIIVKPPEHCAIEHIGNKSLEEVLRGVVTAWSAIATNSGGTCTGTIKRVVREDGSGTTYQFKHYLFDINKNAVEGTETWENLQPETTKNLEWPNEGTVVRPTNKGGGEEVAKVKSEAGAIGYANLPDATAGGLIPLKLQNNEEGGATFAEISKGEEEANCKEVTYSTPSGAEAPDANWSNVYGSNPEIGGSTYPLCTLTWDVALVNAEQAGLTKAEGEETHTYLKHVVEGGQTEINTKHGYAALPTTIKTIAVNLVSLIK